jgi:UDP-N-acetylmuramyl pentapeptide phosphotransferase/UDP-N-acetylglucosamine-1-phosphate transferase
MGFIYTFIATILVAYFISRVSIPAIIKVAEQKHLYDEPDDSRKFHSHRIPTLGGIAIFGGMLISATFFLNFTQRPELAYSIPAFLLLFFTGVKDDIIPLSPIKKLIAQIIASAIVVYKSDVRLTNMYGFFGLNEISYEVSVIVSIFTILVIINSFNLIDGINGLAGGIGLIVSVVYAILFFELGRFNFVIFALAFVGALAGFLHYNLRVKAKIFMGDTGSLLIGLAMAMFCIKFIEINKNEDLLFKPTFGPTLCFAILIVPLYDTLRVFILRISKGISPFRGDRNHLHHLITNLGFNHPQASFILYAVNAFFIGFVLIFKDLPQIYALVSLLGLAYLGSFSLEVLNKRMAKKKESATEKDQLPKKENKHIVKANKDVLQPELASSK